MAQEQIRLYYKSVTAPIIGEEHGITEKQFAELKEQTEPLIPRIGKEITGGTVRYGLLPQDSERAHKINNLSAELRPRCENLVILGIGGSALGNIALQTALNPYMYSIDRGQRQGPRLFVFDNVDPEQFASFLDWIDDKLDKTIFNVISKSGWTTEPIAQFMIIRQKLLEKLGTAGLRDQVVATTHPEEGILREIADNSSSRCLEVPDGVGGRFSVLSDVGLFSAAMCGIDIDSLLEGARDMNEKVSAEKFWENPAAINAAINYHFYTRGKRNSVIMPYSYALKDMADWYRQLWAESLGKSRDLWGSEIEVGPTPVKALGATDQHSQVQLYREGPNDKLFTFLEVKDFDRDIEIGPAPECAPELDFLAGKSLGTLLNYEKKATEYALLESRRPCLTVLFDRVNAYTVGQFIYFFEVTTSLMGALLNINPYDQPAVELGKEATFALMGRSAPTYEKFAREIHDRTDIDERFLV